LFLQALNEQDGRSHVDSKSLQEKSGFELFVAGMRTIIIDEAFARRYFPNFSKALSENRLHNN
jgi:hypothetical protein